ncbi:12173_t:CDS:1, partial [Funneliformis caledonium]
KNDGTKYEIETYKIVDSSNDIHAWTTNVRLGKGDKGVDIIGSYKEMQFIIQCKDFAKKLSINYVRELNGIMTNNSNLLRIMVSRGGFTKNALDFGKKNKDLILTDLNNILSEIQNHYEKNKIEISNAREHARNLCQ